MASPTLFTYRQLGGPSGGDPLRGLGQQNVLQGLPATAQAIATSSRLLLGEVWYALNIGTPLFQSILGVPNTNAGVALIMRRRILNVPYVVSIQNLVVTYQPTRAYTFTATVLTAFGTVQISNQPLPGTNA